MEEDVPFPVDSRVSVGGHRGTVRFVGEVKGTSGIWLGVEWDETTRGKHSGEHGGVLYFQCRIPGSGSFIRPSSKISSGQSFISALKNKYLGDIDHDLTSPSHTGLSQDHKTISTKFGKDLELIGMEKIRKRVGKLDSLRVVGLDGEDVNGAGSKDEEDMITTTCPGIRDLDLSSNLLSDLQAVARITKRLPSLEELTLNSNCFMPYERISEDLSDAFLGVRTLRLNRTRFTWNEACLLSSSLPKLEDFELAFNGLTRLTVPGPNLSVELPFMCLVSLNLDGNDLDDWADVIRSTASISSLRRLILSRNKFTETTPDARAEGTKERDGSSAFPLSSLNLSDNELKSWNDLDSLASQFPDLRELWITPNPFFVEGGHDERAARLLVIARIASLASLDGRQIDAGERRDAERFYLSVIQRENLVQDKRKLLHPRFEELALRYGFAEAPRKVAPGGNTLRSKLLDVEVHVLSPPDLSTSPKIQRIQILPNTTIRALRARLARVVGCPVPSADGWRLIASLKDGLDEGSDPVRVELEEDRETVRFYGVASGDTIDVSNEK